VSAIPAPVRPTPPGGLLAELRGDPEGRAPVDPGLAGGLRAWLEDEVWPAAAGRHPERPLVLGPGHLIGSPGGAAAPETRAAAALTAALFRQWVTTQEMGDPLDDALAALEADPGRAELVAVVHHLPAGDLAALATELGRRAATIRRDWTGLPAAWLARPGERLGAALAGGRVRLHCPVDLVLGRAGGPCATVGVVLLRSGPAGPAHAQHLALAALLETLRHGAPPARLASYGTARGDLEVVPADDGLLAEAVRRVGAAARAAGR
jgi:hypothetical protein